MLDTEIRQQLCSYFGLALSYRDFEGKEKFVESENLELLLAAMGATTSDATRAKHELAKLQREDAERILAPVYLLKANGPHHIRVQLPPRFLDQGLAWRLTEERGRSHSGNWRPGSSGLMGEDGDVDASGAKRRVRTALTLSDSLEQGYHRFELFDEKGEILADTELIVVPSRCYEPEALQAEQKLWGASIQLYTVRTRRNWGIGDFTDLRTLLQQAAALKMDAIGLNPLHALFPSDPGLYCPYAASNRLFLNYLYIDVEAVPEFHECVVAKKAAADRHFQTELANLRAANLVDYSGVARVKLEILELLYRYFREQGAEAGSTRQKLFADFLAVGGQALARHGLYDALHAHFRAKSGDNNGWSSWPEGYRDPESPEVAKFALEHAERVNFYLYLQFLAAEQLEGAHAYAQQLGLRIGVYGDIAIGVNSQGSEIWSGKSLYAFEATLGVPPDELGPQGQNWDLPPISPRAMVANRYRPFRELLRGNMRYCGALRVDHILGLLRLFWIPRGHSAKDGAYVYYALEDFLGILALESQRNRCLVIGEDLGTVPPEIREEMARYGIYSYKVFYFEREPNGDFKDPLQYPSRALATVSTHDLPTLTGFWSGEDIHLRDRMGMYPNAARRDELLSARAKDRMQMLEALERQGLKPAELHEGDRLAHAAELALIEAVHVYMARCGAGVLMVQLEDWLGMIEGVNIPGTSSEYPNWRRKLSQELERMFSEPRFHRLTQLINDNRQIRPTKNPSLWRRILNWLGLSKLK